MNSGELCASHYRTREPLRVTWKNGIITRLEPAAAPSSPAWWIAPGLVDLQINGYAGVDFQRDVTTEEDLVRAVHALQAAGCGRFLLTLMTDRWEAMLRRLEHLRALRNRSAALRAAIAGWHLEGPFLSAAPGFCGAHAAEWMIDPSPDHIRRIGDITQTDPVLITVAPERPGAIAAIREAVSLGMRVSLGHTDASDELLRDACRAGATGFTHLGNACPQQLDRHDNILWRVLDREDLLVSLIPDGRHVSPAFFRLVCRVLGRERVYCTTDAVAAAAAPPGRYSVGRHEVEVGPDRIVREPGKTNYAGSALEPLEGVGRAAQMLGRPWQEVWDLFSIQPARWMGWLDGLAVDQPAHFCIVETGEGEELRWVQTVVGGS